MSSRAEALKAKAARLAAQQETKAAPKTSTPAAPATADDRTPDDRQRTVATAANPHVKPVRSTVDLMPAQHAQLKTWCNETAVVIGKSRVTTQDIMRAMVARLLTDETFARKMRNDLRTTD
jgi:hypothetical protein